MGASGGPLWDAMPLQNHRKTPGFLPWVPQGVPCGVPCRFKTIVKYEVFCLGCPWRLHATSKVIVKYEVFCEGCLWWFGAHCRVSDCWKTIIKCERCQKREGPNIHGVQSLEPTPPSHMSLSAAKVPENMMCSTKQLHMKTNAYKNKIQTCATIHINIKA